MAQSFLCATSVILADMPLPCFKRVSEPDAWFDLGSRHNKTRSIRPSAFNFHPSSGPKSCGRFHAPTATVFATGPRGAMVIFGENRFNWPRAEVQFLQGFTKLVKILIHINSCNYLAHTPLVGGSNPSWPTNFSPRPATSNRSPSA